MKKGSETTQTPHSPHKYVERLYTLYINKEKDIPVFQECHVFYIGDPYGVRTHECILERDMS